MYLSSDAGGIRTRNREGLSFAAVPVRVPRQTQVVRVGLEPRNVISASCFQDSVLIRPDVFQCMRVIERN